MSVHTEKLKEMKLLIIILWSMIHSEPDVRRHTVEMFFCHK